VWPRKAKNARRDFWAEEKPKKRRRGKKGKKKAAIDR